MNHMLKIMAIKQQRKALRAVMSQCRREERKRQITWTAMVTEIGHKVQRKMHPCAIQLGGLECVCKIL